MVEGLFVDLMTFWSCTCCVRFQFMVLCVIHHCTPCFSVITGLTMERSGHSKVWFSSTWNGALVLALTMLMVLLTLLGLGKESTAGLVIEETDTQPESFWKQVFSRVALLVILGVPIHCEAVVTWGLCDTIMEFDIRKTRLGNEDDRPKLLTAMRLLWPRTVKLLSR